MNRRKYLSSIMATIIGYKFLKNKPNNINLNIKNKNNNINLPPLIHNSKLKPAEIIPKSKSYIKINLPENINIGEIMVTQNKYSKQNNIYNRKKLNIKNTNNNFQLYKFKTKNVNNIFAYTLYYRIDNSDSWIYIGESQPLRIQNDNIDIMYDYIDFEQDSDRVQHSYFDKIGYFEMKYTRYDKDILVYISKQYFNKNKRIYLYHNAHEYSTNNKFVSYMYNRFMEQHQNLNRIQKIEELSTFVQNLRWVSDRESLNKYEYIRTPHHTCSVGMGDCKDTTILLNGLIKQGLDIETAILFSSGHMLTGIKMSDLTQKEIKYIKNTSYMDIYETKDSKYIPIESTRFSPIGKQRIGGKVHTIYSNKSYKIINPSIIPKHTIEFFNNLIKY